MRRHFNRGAIAAALSFAAACAAPTEARAELFRVGAYGGVERISGDSASTLFQLRGEATMSMLPWLHGGVYAQALLFGDGGRAGYGGGLLATFRPDLPAISIDPMGYASVGYQRAPAGAGFASGFTIELGAGLSWSVSSLVAIELRGGYVGLLGSNGANGFSGALGLSLSL